MGVQVLIQGKSVKMADPKIIIAEDNDQVAKELIQVVAEAVKNASDPDKVTIGVSGGSLPKFLAAGIKLEAGKSIDWSKIKFLFCDERMVPVEDPESTLGVYLKLLEGTEIGEKNFVKVT